LGGASMLTLSQILAWLLKPFPSADLVSGRSFLL
jgi:hypothetical protein